MAAKQREQRQTELGPLPGGHHGLSREQVADSQRERLLAAVATVCVERGYRRATVTAIVKSAAVSTRVFYENFTGKDEAFLAAFDAVAAHLEDRFAAAAGVAKGDWPGEVTAVLRVGLDFVAAEPALSRFCLIEPGTASPEIIAHFRATVLGAVPFFRRGRAMREGGDSLPDSTEDSIVGGLISLLSRSLLTGEESPSSLFPDLAEFALSPYLGAELARATAAGSRV
jgi:AcrR family transcriptional regulator